MKCLCCLFESEDRKELIVFTIADKLLYHELTKQELTTRRKLKVCKSCKSALKVSTEFLRLCNRSYDHLMKSPTEDFDAVKRLEVQSKIFYLMNIT